MTVSDDFSDALSAIGIKAVWAPGQVHSSGVEPVEVTLTRGADRQRYSVLLGRPARLDDITRHPPTAHPVMLFTDFVPRRTALALRNAGVQYLDGEGNAWVEFGHVLIDIRGRARPKTTKYETPSPRILASNMFSPTRAQVVFALLAWPQLWAAPRRELAEAAGVSVGLVHDALTRLLDAGLDQSARRADLLNRWTTAFPDGLAKRLTLASYRGDIDSLSRITSGHDMLVSGEVAATQLLRPASAVLYMQNLDPALALAHRWRTDGFANIVVRRKFWHDPRGPSPSREVSEAPWPLVYADLATSDDPRTRDAATEWMDRFSDAG